MIQKTVATIVSTAVLCATSLSAQDEGRAALTLELAGSTRAFALGNAFVLSAPDPDGIFYNPALVARSTGASLSVQRYGSASTLATGAASRTWSSGGLGFGFQLLTYGAPSTNLLAVPVREGELTEPGPNGVSEFVASLSYGRRWLGFDVGVTGKLIDQRVSGARGGSAAADIGLLRRLGPITVGVAAQNLGPDLSLQSVDLPLPFRIGGGVSTGVHPVGPLDVAMTAAIYRLHGGAVAGGGGIEFAWWPIVGRTFTARVGIIGHSDTDHPHLTAGLGFTGDDISIEYGFQDLETTGSVHRFGLRWR
jgi:hypothetical protein